MIPPDKLAYYMQNRIIEVAPLAYMRGRTLDEAFVILDEAQNTTHSQMKMFLTRLGENSRMIITGDPSQVDLPNGQPSGLAEAAKLLDGVEGIAQVRFALRQYNACLDALEAAAEAGDVATTVRASWPARVPSATPVPSSACWTGSRSCALPHRCCFTRCAGISGSRACNCQKSRAGTAHTLPRRSCFHS